ncbi:exodeoxyribonuclease III [Gammaproteobacteria bacterium]|nr:exodeoxyribonuclease III [Gammaproteobacteria bacterium]
MKFISWNVNGVRAAMKKDFLNQFTTIDADFFCLQETKAQDDQVKEALSVIEGYHVYMTSAVRKGYSGTAVLSKQEALNVSYGIGIEEHDQEGRVVCAEYEKFYLVNVYVPNSGSELARLDYRSDWDKAFYNYLKGLETMKPVVVCGDFNVAHTAIDLARPKPNYNKSAGYTQTEIDGMDRFVNGGFIDTFRFFYPTTTEAYSWWSYRGGARAKNVGWRIDYFLVSQALKNSLQSASILADQMGSDHCPILLEIK